MSWRILGTLGTNISRIGRKYVKPNHIYFAAQLPNALMFRQYVPDSETKPSSTSSPSITNMEKKFINQENVSDNVASVEATEEEEKEKSIRNMKYTLLGLAGAFVAFSSFLFINYGAPDKDEDGQLISDEFSDLPVLKQYFFRGIKQVHEFAAFLREPSREKLLPDPLAYPFYQPPYTLVLEFTDVLAHPEWTYQTGWRFKKRPGVDHLLENLAGTYEIVVYTHEPGITVFPLIDALDNKGLISFKLVRDCTHFIDGHHVKNLGKLNRDLKKVIMIDWDTESVKLHGENHFVIDRWEGKDDDNTLVDLTYFLHTIAENKIDDVRDVIKFYKQFDDPLTVFKQKQLEQETGNHQEKLDTKTYKGIVRRWTEDNVRKAKKKKKQKIIHKTKLVNKIKTNGTEKVKTISSSVSEKIINGKKRIKSKMEETIFKKAEDKTPLTSSFSEENVTNFTSKKGLKRKRKAANSNDETKHFKKTKQEIITKKKITSKPSNANDQFQEERVNSKKRKKKKNKNEQLPDKKNPVLKNTQDVNPKIVKKRKEQLEKLKTLITNNKGQHQQMSPKKQEPILTLRQKMISKLKAARFRFLNEQIYSTTGQETEKIFRRDPEAFKAYHEGYKQQMKKWPLNPVDKLIKSLNKIDKNSIIADFGCGEAKLAKSLQQKVHSFDLVASNELVTACDMAHVPLEASSVDVVVFCLSLMGTNLKDYLLEANRILKTGGMLKIAEVESRFEDVHAFIKSCEQFGFKKTWMDLSYNLFYFIDFKKESNAKDKKKLPVVSLQPCLYKKR